MAMDACGAARGFESRITRKPSIVTGASRTVYGHYRVLVCCFGEGGQGDASDTVSETAQKRTLKSPYRLRNLQYQRDSCGLK
jgi:hypothetical protein